MKKLLTIVCAFLLLLGGIVMNISAEDSNLTVTGTKKASPTELSPNNRETTVTLQLPSGEYQNKVDIVFVMDNSTSATINSTADFAENVSDLLGSIDKTGIDLKVGVVKFRGYATDMLGSGLKPYVGNESAILDAVKNDEVPGSGSNAHSGLVMAEQLLSADEEVANSNKYVIFLTDGKNYIWNNAKNEPVTYYTQRLSKLTVQNSGKPVLNQVANNYNKEQGADIYVSIPVETGKEYVVFNPVSASDPAYYQRVYDSENPEFAATDTKYDEPAYYTKYYSSYTGTPATGDGSVEVITPTNGTTLFPRQTMYQKVYAYTPDESTFWKDIDYLQIAPFELIENEDGTYAYDTEKPNEDFFLWHPDCMQKGLYQVGHYWKEVIDAKYNTGSIVYYKTGSGAGTNLCSSFDYWLIENSDYGAWTTNSDDVNALFEDIDRKVRYMVAKGTVIDEITDEFELKDVENPFKIEKEVEGELPVTKLEDNHWAFGTPIEGDEGEVYPYEIIYDPATKTITWTLNVPVENSNRVSLSYPLVIDEDAEEGEHDTNKSAVLDYVTTDGADGSFTFEVPVVTYKKPKPKPDPKPDPDPEPFVFPATGVDR